MHAAHRRLDITDTVWELLEPHLSGRAGSWGDVAHDNRRFINGVFWILHTGAPGVICPKIMVTGKTRTDDSVAGEIEALGRGC